MHRAEAQAYPDSFLETTGWQPEQTRIVAGALYNTELDYFRRELARNIVQRTAAGADAAENYDFTDYDDLRAFLMNFLETVVKPNLANKGAN